MCHQLDTNSCVNWVLLHKESHLEYVRYRLNQPTPVWISLFFALLLIFCGVTTGLLYEKSSDNLRQAVTDLKSLSQDIESLEMDVNSLDSDVRQLKSDSDDLELSIDSLRTSVKKLEESLFTICVWVSIRQGRYIC